MDGLALYEANAGELPEENARARPGGPQDAAPTALFRESAAASPSFTGAEWRSLVKI